MTSNAGRPTLYTPELVDSICDEIAGGRSLKSICEDDEMPDKATVFRWIGKHPEFRDKYARACEERTYAMAEEALEIADDSGVDVSVDDEGHYTVNGEAINRARLRIDTRKWFVSKMNPKKFGDRQAYELTGKDGGPIEHAVSDPTDMAKVLLSKLAG